MAGGLLQLYTNVMLVSWLKIHFFFFVIAKNHKTKMLSTFYVRLEILMVAVKGR